MMAKEEKIAIIGAGVSGIYCAQALLEKGYKNITLYEASDALGGKVCSYWYQGKMYELGAYTLSNESANDLEVDEAASSLHINPQERIFNTLENRMMTSRQFVYDDASWLGLYFACKRYKKLLKQYRHIFKNPGFNNEKKIPPQLTTQVQFYSKMYNITSLTNVLTPIFAGMGFGDLQQMPMLYLLKYCDNNMLKNLSKSFFKNKPNKSKRHFHKGYLEFLKTKTEDISIKLNCKIEKVTRDEKEGIILEAKGGRESFDKLIITTPPAITMDFLDSQEDELELFQQVKYQPYYVSLFDCKDMGFKVGSYCTYLYNELNYVTPRTTMMVKPYKNSNIMLAYHSFYEAEQEELVKQELEQTVIQLGGHFREVMTLKSYPHYFPHVDGKAIKNKFFAKFDELQGKRNTYHIGSLFNFELTGNNAAYAKKFVDAHF